MLGPMIHALPLLCYDERPCQLLGDVRSRCRWNPDSPGAWIMNMNGTAHVVCCLPLNHRRGFGTSKSELNARQWIMLTFCAISSSAIIPGGAVRLVQDNLNTHTPGSFYHVWPPAKAFTFAQRFELHYTPKKGSWLNMAEIEFAALATQCLDRRIPDQGSSKKKCWPGPARAIRRGKQYSGHLRKRGHAKN